MLALHENQHLDVRLIVWHGDLVVNNGPINCQCICIWFLCHTLMGLKYWYKPADRVKHLYGFCFGKFARGLEDCEDE